MDHVKIKSIYQSEEPKSNLVVRLKNEYINDCSGFEIDLYTNKKNSKTFVIASNNGLVYSGEPANKDAVCENYLLIVNRKKKRARLLPTSVCDLSEINTKDDNIKLPDLSDFTSKAAHLTDKFGSKRSKRNREMINKMRVNPDACEQLLKPILDETQIDLSLVDLEDGSESLELLIPPCNRFASTPQSVYNANDLLSENEKESLKEAANFLIENPPVKGDSTYSLFLTSHYKFVSKNINSDSVILLIYADCLLNLLRVHPKELKQRDAWSKISPHSKLIASKLKKEFTSSKMITTQMRHKIGCHALVIILLTCGFQIDLNLISPCFSGINHQRLFQLCRLVGVSSHSRYSDILTLKVPMPPLPISKSPKKKKR